MISYSGLVNYGKATLPSVESWGTNMNIEREPTKSVHTRKIDKVGETSFITQKIADSGDRYCEAINYYARGQNPMVSVDYGAGDTGSSSRNAAFLPYRVARDGAFRPPILRQEDLLPLSRLPRQWTTMATQPYLPIFTKRIKNCGTAENTTEVKDALMKLSCETQRSINQYPDVNAPNNVPLLIRDPLVPGEIRANYSAQGVTSSEQQKKSQNVTPRLLAPNRPVAMGNTNFRGIKEKPIVFHRVELESNHPTAVGYTNYTGGYGQSALRLDATSYNRLPGKPTKECYEGRASVPAVTTNHPGKQLKKVR